MSYPAKNEFYVAALVFRGFTVKNGRAEHPTLKGRKGKNLAHKAWLAACKMASLAGLGYTGCGCCGEGRNPFGEPNPYMWGTR